jgi:Ras-related C3 botulinum toxin substrate 1
VVLVGTKLDLRASGDVDGCVATKEGEAVGKKIGAERYVECSALTQDNLGAVFDSAVDVCMKRRAALRDKGERNQGAQASGCCSIS